MVTSITIDKAAYKSPPAHTAMVCTVDYKCSCSQATITQVLVTSIHKHSHVIMPLHKKA